MIKFKNKFLVAMLMMFLVMILPKSVVFAGTNNSQEAAQVISVNTSYSGSMDSEYAWYKTELTESGYFYLDFDRFSEDGDKYVNVGWKLSIYVDDKFILEDVWVSEANSAYKSPNYGYPKGTIAYIRIQNDGAGTKVPYKFSVYNQKDSYWESEKNDTQKTANTLTLKKSYYGNFSKADTVDYFSTKMNKTGYAQIHFGRRDLDGDKYVNAGWKISVIVNNKIVLDPVFVSEATALDGYVSPQFGYKKGQKIYVRVENDGAGTAVDYKIQVKCKASALWETENNDSKSKADKLKLNKKYYGVCTRNNDSDWFKYKAAKNGTLKFYGGKRSLDDSGWYTFEVYVKGKRVLSASNYNNAIGKLGSFSVKKGQTVYVKVSGNYRSAYALKLKY
ncbi:MAG: hypothetical protein J6A92_02110 [Lachnospiraceae bacterium]|nr:hypothetical protein [Lachnospiraceae bacterium]